MGQVAPPAGVWFFRRLAEEHANASDGLASSTQGLSRLSGIDVRIPNLMHVIRPAGLSPCIGKLTYARGQSRWSHYWLKV